MEKVLLRGDPGTEHMKDTLHMRFANGDETTAILPCAETPGVSSYFTDRRDVVYASIIPVDVVVVCHGEESAS
jgi:hypothetical protein